MLQAEQAEKKVLTLEDYPKWKHIQEVTISDNGDWITYGYRPNGGDVTLYIKSLETEKIYDTTVGSDPKISSDSRWAAYKINLSKEEAKKLRKEKKPVTTKVELLDLRSGDKVTYANASSFVFSNDSGFFAVKKDKSDKEAKHDGTDLVLRNLKTGLDLNIGNVGSFRFNHDGTMLAYTIDADKKAGNGVYALVLESGAIRPLDSGEADYAQLTWDDNGRKALEGFQKGKALAVLKGKKPEKFVQKENELLVFMGLGTDASAKIIYAPSDDKVFPEGMVLSEKGELTWSEDNSRIYCGIKEQEAELEKSEDPVANVDVWHWKDERLQSVQMVRADRDKRFTYRSVFLLKSKRLIQLTNEAMPTVSIPRNGKYGVGRENKKYRADVNRGRSTADYYRIDLDTGKRTLIIEELPVRMGLDPDGKYFLYFKGDHLWIYDMAGEQHTNISESAPVSFVNVDMDTPTDKRPWGIAGWTKDRKSLIVYHKYDVWSLSLDGSQAANLTKGRGDEQEIRFRYVRLDTEERHIDTSEPLLLSAYGEWTKNAGYFHLNLDGNLKELVYEDVMFSRRVTKAKKADKILYTRETFVDFPDYYVSDTRFQNPVKVTDANPHQKEYAWGRRILIDYENSRGVKLQATLTLPAGYVEGKKYPMLVYFYEKMSQRHHDYSMPTYDDRPHMSAYASDGYLVLMPDIVYTVGTPGSNALDCVSAAVQKVIDLGYADPDHIGLQGHSWGGYQSSFIVTQTDIFACVVTGAPLTNLPSMYNILYKSTGNTNQGIIETSQGRFGKDVYPMKDLELYVSQSPMHHAAKISTPFMILHGTEDGAVDWNQGLEFYTSARRLGKEVILLSYPGEPHHLRKEENQKDFQLRMKQYFDHYLKGTPAPDWMIHGIPFLKKKFKEKK
ncbi:MAG: S9 family peptidase [Candidatus Aminicenantes bacterium]|nr:MAG: S9 family peptidase [Candidatus Aminicenantes bacterium]